MPGVSICMLLPYLKMSPVKPGEFKLQIVMENAKTQRRNLVSNLISV